MKNTKNLELNREKDYLVKATLMVNNTVISNVPCKIYLPERTHEKPYVVFKPSEEDALKIRDFHKGAFKATVYGFDNEIQTTFEAPKVYFSGKHTTYWGKDISESTVLGEPQDLHVIHNLRNHGQQEKTHFVFWMSPNKFLAPSMFCSTSYTGEIKYKWVGNFKFTINNGVKLVFEKHFSSKTIKNRDLVQWSFLVACAELDVPAADVETLKNSVLQDIDDFLNVAAFSARERTACLGWSAIDKKSHTTFYRGNYTFPEGNNDNTLDDGVIDIQDFERFMEIGYPAFLRYENKLALRNALYSAVPTNPHTIEASYLNTFAGLETLILDFRRRRQNREFVLPPTEWNALRKYLQNCIKTSTEPKLKPEQRASIYRKLGELNRVSLRESFEEFCQEYAIDLSDLWPVFGENRIVGLVDIRNKLIHGDPFPFDLYRALIVAKEHLKYTLERVLVKVLGWDVAQTKINPTYLGRYFSAMKDLPSERARLSEYIKSINVE